MPGMECQLSNAILHLFLRFLVDPIECTKADPYFAQSGMGDRRAEVRGERAAAQAQQVS